MLPLTFAPGAKSPLRILCFGAHSDDIEIGCGGSLLRLLSERPCEVRWVVMSAGGERRAEAERSARALLAEARAAEITIREFRESYFPFIGAELKDFFEGLKRECSPDVIFCHRRADAHQDHATVAQLTWNTFRDHLVLEYEIPKYEGDLGHPNLFVPLTKSVATRKIEHLLAHFPSQVGRSWFRSETFAGLMNVRAVECNARDGFAEAFELRKAIVVP